MRKLTLSKIILVILALLDGYIVLSFLVGIPFQPLFTPLLSLLAFGFCLMHGTLRLGWRLTLLLLGLTFGVSLLFESLGVATGLVYGPYHYTDALGVKFLGLVPLLIPVAWFMMTYPSYIIAGRVIQPMKSLWGWRLLVAASGALIMTAWDLVMDPVMVAGEHWVWEVQGAYFGVPVQNYWGWWLTVFVTFILFLVIGQVRPPASPPPASLDRLAIISYAITGLTSVLNAFIFGLGGPALAGLFAMLPWIVLGWKNSPGDATQAG